MISDLTNKVFLIGNGINRAIPNNVKSWEALLDDLNDHFKTDIDFKNELKPFPLAFEELVHKKKGKDFGQMLIEIKEHIAFLFSDTPSNDCHDKIVKSGIRNILTTNYDYAFEKAFYPGFKNEKEYSPRNTRETLNSLYRRTRLKSNFSTATAKGDEVNIWHIHGEINQRLFPSELGSVSHANSIMIGNEHYGIYLAEIQKYIKSDLKNNYEFASKEFKNKDGKIVSWVDCFFQNEIHIAGFSFDFSEHHLWWLVNYRAKMIRKGRLANSQKNKIFYYYEVTSDKFPEEPSIYVHSLLKRKASKAKIEIMESLGIVTIPITIKINDYKSYYAQFLEIALND